MVGAFDIPTNIMTITGNCGRLPGNQEVFLTWPTGNKSVKHELVSVTQQVLK